MKEGLNQKRLFADEAPLTKYGNEKRENTALPRRVSAYPPIAFVKMITALAHESLASKSSIETKIIREYFKALPLERQQDLIRKYEKMTPEQRNRPGTIREDEE